MDDSGSSDSAAGPPRSEDMAPCASGPCASNTRPWTGLIAHAQARIATLTDELVSRIWQQNVGYAQVHTVPEHDLYRSCYSNIGRVLQLIVAPPAAFEYDSGYFDAAHATGTGRAEQGMPLDDVLRSYRLGGQLIWEFLNDAGRHDETLDGDDLREMGTRLWKAVDATSSRVATAYRDTEIEHVRVNAQRRAALWEGLLSGRAKDPVFAQEAGRLLDLPSDRQLIVLICHQSAPGVETRLEHELRAVGVVSAWQARGGAAVGIVEEPSLDAPGRAVRELLDARIEPHVGAVGVSLPVSGLSELDIGYQQAVLALRAGGSAATGVVALDEHLPEALLLNSPELARYLAARWLEPLLALDACTREPLLETLRVWADTGGSTRATAQSLFCHRNTVINRLNRLNEILDYRISDTPIPIELALAIRACDLGAGTHADQSRRGMGGMGTVHNDSGKPWAPGS